MLYGPLRQKLRTLLEVRVPFAEQREAKLALVYTL